MRIVELHAIDSAVDAITPMIVELRMHRTFMDLLCAADFDERQELIERHTEAWKANHKKAKR